MLRPTPKHCAIAILDDALVQLHLRLGAPGDQPCQRVEHNLCRAVEGELMQFVERIIYEARHDALDEQTAANETSHEVADRRIFAERDKRTPVFVAPVPQRRWAACALGGTGCAC